ncbi:MAG: saccharopine dehydrogenase NADP-binding domain-containing protein [Tahibacter sp.]
MATAASVIVYGAYGHTGRFVVAELQRRGWRPIASGRDLGKLKQLTASTGGLSARAAAMDDADALDRALHGTAAVLNCAGPFAATAVPLIEAALRTRIPYLDVAAEVEVAAATFELYAVAAQKAGIVIVPSMAFYGGLGNLLATAALQDWTSADEIRIAYALSSWKPTAGTRATIQTSRQRRGGRRLVYTNQQLEYRTDAAPMVDWTFPAPFGTQTVVGDFLTADSVTIPRHIDASDIRTWMTTAPLQDLSSSDPSPPIATDASGRSSQQFVVDVVARRGSVERRAVASGRDIYAISAPLVVEAMERILHAKVAVMGVRAAGEVFDARDFLQALGTELRVDYS